MKKTSKIDTFNSYYQTSSKKKSTKGSSTKKSKVGSNLKTSQANNRESTRVKNKTQDNKHQRIASFSQQVNNRNASRSIKKTDEKDQSSKKIIKRQTSNNELIHNKSLDKKYESSFKDLIDIEQLTPPQKNESKQESKLTLKKNLSNNNLSPEPGFMNQLSKSTKNIPSNQPTSTYKFQKLATIQDLEKKYQGKFFENEKAGLFNMKEGERNIKVICRFRPTNKKENELTSQNLGQIISFFPNTTTVCIPNNHSDKDHIFSLDRVYSPETPQLQIFQEIGKEATIDVCYGFNCTIFAYGQSGSGKTHTMFGESEIEEKAGIIPRSVYQIFEHIEKEVESEYIIQCSLLEIYKERLHDLLAEDEETDLKIMELPSKGIQVVGLNQISVSEYDEVLELLEFGTQNRTVRATQMNEYSSRSHTIFTLTLTQKQSELEKKGQMNLVDLAGSEKVSKSGSSGEALDEAKKINLSLTCLGMVINQLTSKKSDAYIPYRDSKLTRILQDSLGGNFKTYIITTASPHSIHYDETISTLKFAQRAKTIKTKFKANITCTPAQLQKQMNQMKAELEQHKQSLTEFSSIFSQLYTSIQTDVDSEQKVIDKDKIVSLLYDKTEDGSLCPKEILGKVNSILTSKDFQLGFQQLSKMGQQKQEEQKQQSPKGGRSPKRINFSTDLTPSRMNKPILKNSSFHNQASFEQAMNSPGKKSPNRSKFADKTSGLNLKMLEANGYYQFDSMDPNDLALQRILYNEKQQRILQLEKEVLTLKNELLQIQNAEQKYIESKSKERLSYSKLNNKTQFLEFQREIQSKQIDNLTKQLQDCNKQIDLQNKSMKESIISTTENSNVSFLNLDIKNFLNDDYITQNQQQLEEIQNIIFKKTSMNQTAQSFSAQLTEMQRHSSLPQVLEMTDLFAINEKHKELKTWNSKMFNFPKQNNNAQEPEESLKLLQANILNFKLASEILFLEQKNIALQAKLHIYANERELQQNLLTINEELLEKQAESNSQLRNINEDLVRVNKEEHKTARAILQKGSFLEQTPAAKVVKLVNRRKNRLGTKKQQRQSIFALHNPLSFLPGFENRSPIEQASAFRQQLDKIENEKEPTNLEEALKLIKQKNEFIKGLPNLINDQSIGAYNNFVAEELQKKVNDLLEEKNSEKYVTKKFKESYYFLIEQLDNYKKMNEVNEMIAQNNIQEQRCSFEQFFNQFFQEYKIDSGLSFDTFQEKKASPKKNLKKKK